MHAKDQLASAIENLKLMHKCLIPVLMGADSLKMEGCRSTLSNRFAECHRSTLFIPPAAFSLERLFSQTSSAKRA